MSDTKTKTDPRSIDAILEQKSKGGRPPGAKNKKTLKREAEIKQQVVEDLKSKGVEIPPTVDPTAPAPDATDQQPRHLSLDEEIKNIRAEAAPPPPAPTTEQPKVDGTTTQQPAAAAPAPPAAPTWYFTGHLLLIVVDSYFTAGLAFVLNRFAGYDLRRDQLALTDKEVEHMTPVANEVARLIMLSPPITLGIMLGGCYLGKIPPAPKKSSKSTPEQ